MVWKNWPEWLRWGLIGAFIGLVLLFTPLGWISALFVTNVMRLAVFPFPWLPLPLLGFILGALINLFVRKKWPNFLKGGIVGALLGIIISMSVLVLGGDVLGAVLPWGFIIRVFIFFLAGAILGFFLGSLISKLFSEK